MLKTKENDMLFEKAIQCSDDANAIQYALVKLNAVQDAVSKLVENLNELDRESLNGTAQLIIGQIDSQVRMIDMALYPLTKDLVKDSKTLADNTEILYQGFKTAFE